MKTLQCIQIILINIITAAVGLFAIYFAYSLYINMTLPNPEIVDPIEIKVINPTTKKTKLDKILRAKAAAAPIDICLGDIVVVKYQIERLRPVKIIDFKIIKTTQGSEYTFLEHSVEVFKDPIKKEIVAERFNIPLAFLDREGPAKIYIKKNYQEVYDIVSSFKPKTFNTPVIDVIVADCS